MLGFIIVSVWYSLYVFERSEDQSFAVAVQAVQDD